MIASTAYKFFSPVVQACPKKLIEVSATAIQNVNLDVDPMDGKFLSCSNCSNDQKEKKCNSNRSGSTIPSKLGLKQPSHKCAKVPVPKIVYVNGINTSPEQNCYSSQNIADTLCAEVASFYNATYGIIQDGTESVRNMLEGSPAPDNPSFAFEDYLRQNNGEKITIVAHSQGGLITRQALKSISNANLANPDETSYPLENITVISAGTAEHGWPDGPTYTRYTNSLDVVPKLIRDVESSFFKQVFHENSSYSQNPNTTIRRFTSFKDLALGHSMDDVYVPAIRDDVKDNFRRKGNSLCESCPHQFNQGNFPAKGSPGRMY